MSAINDTLDGNYWAGGAGYSKSKVSNLLYEDGAKGGKSVGKGFQGEYWHCGKVGRTRSNCRAFDAEEAKQRAASGQGIRQVDGEAGQEQPNTEPLPESSEQGKEEDWWNLSRSCSLLCESAWSVVHPRGRSNRLGRPDRAGWAIRSIKSIKSTKSIDSAGPCRLAD